MPKSNSITGADRYNFMMALTGYLIARGQQPLTKVANHFGVSEKELRAALVTISLSGIGHYRPDELFFLDYDLLEEGIVDLSFAPTMESAPRLSTKQAAALSAGLNYLASLVEQEDQEEIVALIELLGKGTSAGGSLPIGIQQSEADPNLIQLRQAIKLSHPITCEYRNSKGEVSTRVLEPAQLQSRGKDWYLSAYCLTHQEVRVFRVDRMRAISIDTAKTLSKELDAAAGQDIYAGQSTDTEVLFEVEPEGYGLIADYKPEYEFTGVATIRVSIPIGHLANLGKIVSRYGGKVRVLAPESARIAVRDFVQQALSHKSLEREAE